MEATQPGTVIHEERRHRSNEYGPWRSRGRNLWRWCREDAGAVAIEYVIVAIALLAIAGAIAAALTTLGDDAVANIPGSVSEAGG